MEELCVKAMLCTYVLRGVARSINQSIVESMGDR